MNFKSYLTILLSTLLFVSCEDNTSTLGVDMMPPADLVTKNYETYDVETVSYPVGDAVLARTSMSYFGRFTDPETGTTIKSDFLAQYHCTEGFKLPNNIVGDEAVQVELNLFLNEFVGDSLSTFKLSVYELNKKLDPNADYYTNINPEDYYDPSSEPIATKWFTISDRTITDSARWSSDYNNNIRIVLPKEIGTKIIRDYKEHPEHYLNTSTWLNSGMPLSNGTYFKLESGDGAMAYIYIVQLNIAYKVSNSGNEKTDTLGIRQFAATEEVIQASRFQNSNLQKLLDDKYATYLKSPAGIFTKATLPADQINMNDTINSASITFTRYNDLVQSSFKLGIPKRLLMVRLDDYNNGFFENYKLSDNRTSYIATFNSTTNTYEFDNIARLLTEMVKEKKEGKASEHWNEVLLIPVDATYDSSGKLVKLNHDFSMSSAKLVGGLGDKVKLNVIYSHFK